MKIKSLQILLYEPGKPTQVHEIPDTLKAMQAVVGGSIQCIWGSQIDLPGTMLICNGVEIIQERFEDRLGITGPFFFLGEGFRSITHSDLQNVMAVLK